MRDQDVITRLMELHDHIQSPATPAGDDALRGERRVRRRRTLTVVAAAAAAVLTVGVVQNSPSEDARDLQPAPAP
jgi:type VI protein secretion system component VasF